MPDADGRTDEGAPSEGALALGVVERACLYLCCVALAVMIAVVAADIATRSLFGFSFELAEEVSGYMLVALTFFALAVGQARDSFHRVEFLHDMLSPRAQVVARLAFDIFTLGFALLLTWHLFNYLGASLRYGYSAPTRLGTPLWIPQSTMVLGAGAFSIALMRTIVSRARLLRSWPTEAKD